MDWFLYNNGLHHERVKGQLHKMVKRTSNLSTTADELFECLTILWSWHLNGKSLDGSLKLCLYSLYENVPT